MEISLRRRLNEKDRVAYFREQSRNIVWCNGYWRQQGKLGDVSWMEQELLARMSDGRYDYE
jgi:hypothetical protein